MAKKILAVVLSLLVILCVIPFSVSADEETVSASQRVAGWKNNLYLVTEKLLDNENSTHWKYVAENNKSIADTMLTYTVFSLYDDAWKNGIDKSISVDRAEEILVSLIEKVDANIGASKLAEVRKVLETAVSLEDLLQKVNGYVKISDVLDSASWSTAFKYIEWTIELEKLYEVERERVIDAYAQILSVQAANDLYIDFLRYVAANCEYGVVVQAAKNLIDDIEDSIDSLIKKEVLSAAGFGASKLFDTAARIAMQSNSYTAVALKVYDIGTSAADKLWNTGDQYALMDQLYTTFFVETCAADWAKSVRDDESYEFAIGTLLSLRLAGAQALYDLKAAQNEGIIGKISNQINYNIGFGNVAEISFLELAQKVLFEVLPADCKEIKSIITVNSNAEMTLGGAAVDKDFYAGENGFYSKNYNFVNGIGVTTLFAAKDEDLRIFSGNKCFATVTGEILLNGGIKQWSVTNAEVGGEDEISFISTLSQGGFYKFGKKDEIRYFSDEFVYPEYNAVTTETVVEAVKELVKQEISTRIISFEELIDSIFSKIIEVLRSLFAFR